MPRYIHNVHAIKSSILPPILADSCISSQVTLSAQKFSIEISDLSARGWRELQKNTSRPGDYKRFDNRYISATVYFTRILEIKIFRLTRGGYANTNPVDFDLISFFPSARSHLNSLHTAFCIWDTKSKFLWTTVPSRLSSIGSRTRVIFYTNALSLFCDTLFTRTDTHSYIHTNTFPPPWWTSFPFWDTSFFSETISRVSFILWKFHSIRDVVSFEHYTYERSLSNARCWSNPEKLFGTCVLSVPLIGYAEDPINICLSLSGGESRVSERISRSAALRFPHLIIERLFLRCPRGSFERFESR